MLSNLSISAWCLLLQGGNSVLTHGFPGATFLLSQSPKLEDLVGERDRIDSFSALFSFSSMVALQMLHGDGCLSVLWAFRPNDSVSSHLHLDMGGHLYLHLYAKLDNAKAQLRNHALDHSFAIYLLNPAGAK